MRVSDEIIDALANDYGLDKIMEQNDITPSMVLLMLVEKGLVDLEDYLFEDMEDVDD